MADGCGSPSAESPSEYARTHCEAASFLLKHPALRRLRLVCECLQNVAFRLAGALPADTARALRRRREEEAGRIQKETHDSNRNASEEESAGLETDGAQPREPTTQQKPLVSAEARLPAKEPEKPPASILKLTKIGGGVHKALDLPRARHSLVTFADQPTCREFSEFARDAWLRRSPARLSSASACMHACKSLSPSMRAWRAQTRKEISAQSLPCGIRLFVVRQRRGTISSFLSVAALPHSLAPPRCCWLLCCQACVSGKRFLRRTARRLGSDTRSARRVLWFSSLGVLRFCRGGATGVVSKKIPLGRAAEEIQTQKRASLLLRRSPAGQGLRCERKAEAADAAGVFQWKGLENGALSGAVVGHKASLSATLHRQWPSRISGFSTRVADFG